jgi:nucleotide-binding universal stress UspA family protein
MTTSVIRGRPLATDFARKTRPTRRSRHNGASAQREPGSRPIVAAVEASAAGLTAAHTAARLARELDLPLIFVYVRRWPWGGLGAPYYQRRLDTEIATARRALGDALVAADEEGIAAEGAILEGRPARRVMEFARHRDAGLVVLGTRRRRFRRSVSRQVIRAADRPVVVAGLAPIEAVATA